MSDAVEVVLDDLAKLLDAAAGATGATPVGTVLRISGLALHTASGIVHTLTVDDLARIKREAAIGEAAGRAAWEASHQNFHRKDPQ